MKKLNLKFKTKITLFMIIVQMATVGIMSFIIGNWAITNIENREKTNIMNTARIVSNSQIVKDALSRKKIRGDVQKYIEEILKSTTDIEVIVVADMKGIRYGHPLQERVGKKFVGGDEKRVIQFGESYVSEAIGTLGREMRAFVPIFDKSNTQIGFVMVGTFRESLEKAKRGELYTIILISLIGLIIGVFVALILSNRIRNDLLGLEPKEIAKLYVEKKGMLDAIHEGIIAINEKTEITLVNNSAVEILNVEEKDINSILGKKVLDVFPTSQMVKVLKSGEAEFNREQVLNDTVILTNRVPIKNDEKIVGVIATFRDKTMINRLAEEITGVKQIIDALRANNHEFMNKLHVILGLIQLGDYDAAKNYIVNETEKQQQIISRIIKNIKDPTIAALILGKLSRAKEMGINLILQEGSCLNKHSGKINSNNLVTIIGNLIENAMESVEKTNKDDKIIELSLMESEDKIEIEVCDSGVGIKHESINKIFDRGFTTKEGSSGVGLSLIYQIINILEGEIKVTSKVNEYARFNIIIPKGGVK